MSKDLRREEIRGLFTLGLMAVLVTLRLNLKPDYTITIGELRNIRVCPILDAILFTWGVYAFFMILAYSSDIFSLRTCNIFKEIAHVCLFLSIMILFAVGIMVVLTNIELSFQVSVFLGFVYLLAKIYEKREQVYDRIKKNYNKVKNKLMKK